MLTPDLGDRITELYAKLAANDSDWQPILDELRAALDEHSESTRFIATEILKYLS